MRRSAVVGGHDPPEVIRQKVTCSRIHISQPKSDGAICKGRTLLLKH